MSQFTQEYTKADILQWILGAFPVDRKQGNELNFPCPKCGHEAFYFNIKKVLGFCHRASCHATFNLEAMVNIVGYGPELSGFVPGLEKEKPKPVKVSMPWRAKKIEKDSDETKALALRGVTWKHIQQFDIHTNKTHVIVPIYEDGVLVQYNSRRVNKRAPVEDWFTDIDPDALRYKYASGRPVTDFILGWDESKMWNEITLVENTFVSMWLRDLNVTTNFGSYLSPRQVDMLLHSKIQRVTFLWDEGADSQKAAKKLRLVGVPARTIHIKGQPDDYCKAEIEALLND